MTESICLNKKIGKNVIYMKLSIKENIFYQPIVETRFLIVPINMGYLELDKSQNEGYTSYPTNFSCYLVSEFFLRMAFCLI